MLRFPLEQRLAAIRSEVEAEKASEGHAGVEYVREPGWFAVRLRPQ